MSDSVTMARPYAEAAYGFAAEHKKVAEWENFLQALALTIGNSHIVQTAEVQSPEDTYTFISKVLDGILDKNQGNFVRLLLENSRLQFAPDIYSEYRTISDKKNQKVLANVISASSLSSEQISNLKKKLEVKYNGTVEMKCSVDPALIGGLIVRIGDEVLDASIRTRLNKLTQSLLS